MMPSRSIFVLVAAAMLEAGSARAEPLAAYMYAPSGADGVPALAAMKPAAIGTVFLKAVDIDSAGNVYQKLDDNGRFYPNAWTGTPRPAFAALINADPGIDWSSANPTTTLTSVLTTHNWQQDYGGGITVDAEFTANIQSFPANWQSTMTALRSLANGQGQNFSLYLSPKYLSAARYPTTAAANAAAIAQILGTPGTCCSRSMPETAPTWTSRRWPRPPRLRRGRGSPISGSSTSRRRPRPFRPGSSPLTAPARGRPVTWPIPTSTRSSPRPT
jgi:hypothetical protein